FRRVLPPSRVSSLRAIAGCQLGIALKPRTTFQTCSAVALRSTDMSTFAMAFSLVSRAFSVRNFIEGRASKAPRASEDMLALLEPLIPPCAVLSRIDDDRKILHGQLGEGLRPMACRGIEEQRIAGLHGIGPVGVSIRDPAREHVDELDAGVTELGI